MPSKSLGSLRVAISAGASYFARRSLLSADAPPAGILDELSQYQQRDQRLDRVSPTVRAFFEHTATLRLDVEPRWRWWAVVYGWLWHLFAMLLGQLCIPVRRSRIETKLLALSADVHGRSSARGVVRSYAGSTRVMQVIVYSVLEDAGEGFMSASFPLPLSVLEGVLRLECIDPDERGETGARLTSDRRAARENDPVGVFLHTPLGRLRLPLGESLSLWDARSSKAPRALTERAEARGATIVGLHEQRLFGAVMVQHYYWFAPSATGS